MKISVHGCGYLGAVHAAAMASLGHTVAALDVDVQRIDMLNAGIPPFHEPGFEALLQAGLESGRLSFSTDPRTTQSAQVHFLCVGTPELLDSPAADLSQVNDSLHALLNGLAPHPDGPHVIVGKSTVPVGTAGQLAAKIAEVLPGQAALIWNPEFLRESHGVLDTLEPDRIIYGTAQDALADQATAILDDVYSTMLDRKTARLITNYTTAELVKVAANSFLATKISFANAMSQICDATQADVTMLSTAIGLDARIGSQFLNAGIGYGGGCLPKDVHAFLARADELGLEDSLRFLKEVDQINLQQRQRVVDLAEQLCGGSLQGRTVGVLGATFKPGTDDLRGSPAVDIALRLRALGAHVRITDPLGLEQVAMRHPELDCRESTHGAASDADLVILATEWPEYAALDPSELKSVVARPIIIDGRNCLDPDRWRDEGWVFHGIGRGAHQEQRALDFALI